MTLRRVAVGLLICAIVAGGAIVAKAEALDAELRGLAVEMGDLRAELDQATERGNDLKERTVTASDENVRLQSVLAVRTDFINAIAALRGSLEKAEGKVDAADSRDSALAVQQSVLAEREDPDVVIAATATLTELSQQLDADVAEWERAQRAVSSAPMAAWSESGAGASGYARVRGALDRVGGGGVGLYESASCAGGSAPACANSEGYIKFRSDVASWDESRLNWAMAHELAHIYQFRVWGAMTSSASYQSMFGADPEFLANCMAVVRGYPGAVGCNAEQQVWASGIWVGAVR